MIIRDHFVLEWKSTLIIVESTLKTVIQPLLRGGFHYNFGADSTPKEVIPNMTPKRVDFHSTALNSTAWAWRIITYCNIVSTGEIGLSFSW